MRAGSRADCVELNLEPLPENVVGHIEKGICIWRSSCDEDSTAQSLMQVCC